MYRLIAIETFIIQTFTFNDMLEILQCQEIVLNLLTLQNFQKLYNTRELIIK